MRIYHVVPTDVWSRFSGPCFEADSLRSEGFIHCSFGEQLDEVVRRYYSGAGDVTILEIDPTNLDSKLIIEPSTGGENYPHIYGPLNVNAIVRTERRQIT